MYTKETLLTQLHNAGVKDTDTLLVHSSMKAIGDVNGGADTVLDALEESVENGLLILPTHSWAHVGADYPYFNHAEEPSCVGMLTERFRNRDDVLRSIHPSHSVAVKGVGAHEYIQPEEEAVTKIGTVTPCSKQGCWGQLYDKNAKILLLGVRFNRNTYLHSVEEWCDIPNRLAHNPNKITVTLSDGRIFPVFSYPHYNETCSDISANFIILEELALQKGAAIKLKFGDADCFLCDAVKLGDLAVSCLEKYPDLFLDDSPIPDELYTM